MANPHKGEVSFDVSRPGGDGGALVSASYTLRYSANAICELEDALDTSVMALMSEMATWRQSPEKMRMRPVRALFWAGLRDNHPDVDLRAAGELMVAAGGMMRAMELIDAAIGRAFPAPETKGARPPKQKRARAGTGPGS